jgi:hypothetical protein
MLNCSKNWNNSYQKPTNSFSITSFFLLLGLIVAPIMESSANEITNRVSEDFSDRVSEIDPPSEGDSLNHPGPLTPYFNTGCALYGVDDYLLNDSYFFCINNQGFQFNSFITGGDYEGLDYNNNESLLFASAGDDAFPAEFNGDILAIAPIPESCDSVPLESLGPVMVDNQAMEEVDGIAFDNQGNLFGWAQEAGLFKVNAGAPSLAGEMLLAQPGEVEDIEVVGDCIIGLLNVDHLGQVEDGNGEQHPNHPVNLEDVNAVVDTNGVIKANYIMYCPGQPLQTPCEQQVINALREYQAVEIEAIDILPALSLSEETTKVLLGFHTNSHVGQGNGNPPPGNGSYNTLVLGILDVTNCSLQTQAIYDIPRHIIETDNLDVEGLAMVCPTY